MERLDGKTALVTGGARGIGGACVHHLAAAGAKVIIADIDADIAAGHADAVRGAGGQVMAIALDVRSEAGWAAAAAAGSEAFGAIDVLVNCAGRGASRDAHNRTIRLHELSAAEWDDTFDINVTGTFLGLRTLVPIMKAHGSGSIINISSTGALVGSRVAAYGSSKGAVRAMTKAAASNLGGTGIRVNSVHPGVIRTRMTDRLVTAEALAGTVARYPLGRIGEPDELAAGIAFLASDSSAFMTGAELVIDGGNTIF